MNPRPSVTTSLKSQDSSSSDTDIEALVTEAKALFKILDDVSMRIRTLESSLGELKAHFPFRHCISEEQESPVLRPPEQRHKEAHPCVTGYWTKVYWFLAWEQDDSSKNYRLFLVSEERDRLASYDENFIGEIHSKILFKKPLIETDLPTRLRHSEHLFSFIIAFKKYLETCRCSIELGNFFHF